MEGQEVIQGEVRADIAVQDEESISRASAARQNTIAEVKDAAGGPHGGVLLQIPKQKTQIRHHFRKKKVEHNQPDWYFVLLGHVLDQSRHLCHREESHDEHLGDAGHL